MNIELKKNVSNRNMFYHSQSQIVASNFSRQVTYKKKKSLIKNMHKNPDQHLLLIFTELFFQGHFTLPLDV